MLRIRHTIAGYVARKILGKLDCEECCSRLIASSPRDEQDYLSLLSRRGLLTPSHGLSTQVCSLFAEVDYMEGLIPTNSISKFAEHSLLKYAANPSISCDEHEVQN